MCLASAAEAQRCRPPLDPNRDNSDDVIGFGGSFGRDFDAFGIVVWDGAERDRRSSH
jgi:hypothetical protein